MVVACVFFSGLVLTILSLLVIVGAGEEPFYGPIIFSQALIQVGLGSVLIFCWLQWMVVVVNWRGHFSRNWPWPFLLVWAGVGLFYLSQCPVGYIEDIIAFQRMSAAAPVVAPSIPSPTSQPATVPSTGR